MKVHLLGGCVVSNTQYASFVLAIVTPSHLICKCRAVFSNSGGRGKFLGFNGAFGGMLGAAFDGGLLS